MSTFSGLNGALSALIAHRQAIDVAGQNIANVNTPGYTRQRANLQGLEGSAAVSFAGTGNAVNGGVQVLSIDRLGDIFLDARLRQETSSSAHLATVAQALSLVETTLAEPGENGLAAQLSEFFTSWEDVANRPDDPAARAVLLENATSLVTRIATGYRDVASQWDSARAQADAVAVEVNTAADAVADLNARIRAVTVSGGSPNSLMDERAQLLTALSSLVGGEVRHHDDGTVDVMVGGNALVRGDSANHITVQGAHNFDGLTGWTAGDAVDPHSGPVRLAWAESGSPITAGGGRLSGLLTVLAPADADGNGGVLAGVAAGYDRVAEKLATSVNSLHRGALRTDGTTEGGDFFSGFPEDGALPAELAALPAALRLGVAITDPMHIAVADPANGPLDGSVADRISQLTNETGSASEIWSQAVVDLGVQTRTAGQRAANAETTRAVAEGLMLSQAGVNLDEETVNLLASQRAYEAAARVLTTIDQTLDTLINRTGVVGR
ncbi:flagellar hook-associated protein FlgK [Georgenia subflava]|uniref:Flagellar hook-associated protein 1 n=1 Tax=Georgenia subflava TaxID=1622177 RepID=A0A6N7EQM8_9MICO|nr:flagellar hook-associated protein FlgK [Georgenia subflava]MPV38446.1 flagellar hook-associated protein FlgK [Georgenia subflava]